MGGLGANLAQGSNGAADPSLSLLAELSTLGLQRPGAADFVRIRKQAAKLIGSHIAPVGALRAVSALHPASLTLRRENGEISGVLAFMPLRPAALLAVATERFDATSPKLDLIATGAERPAAVYLWGLAAVTPPAAVAILDAVALIRRRLPGVPFFARASAPDGRKLLCERLGYTAFPGSVAGLLWSPSISHDDEGR